MIDVEIYSDVVCPWCYIGKRRWERAVEELVAIRGEAVRDQIGVVFRPYQLDPTAPATPTPVTQAYAKKFGGETKAREIIDRVTGLAAAEGLDFHMDIALRANTRNAHRLIEFALQSGGSSLQAQMKERLMRAYFVEGKDVGDNETLASLAANVGLSAESVSVFLQSADGVPQLNARMNEALEIGVSAVPTFVFNGEFALPGAQDSDVFVRVLTKFLDREAL